jgi:phosphogluconate dehydratase
VLKDEAQRQGATAQVAGGVPAMCDGVTQGTPAMDLSLFSRDVIAMATAVALSHDVFDGALMLGICDKIVPGLLIGALQFGHLPTVFVPGGPMTSGLSNSDKSKVRELAAQGKVGRAELLEAEQKAYHGPGTCTFYGTANSNQMLMEAMGLHVPGAAFVNPGNELREALTRESVRTLLQIVKARRFTPIGRRSTSAASSTRWRRCWPPAAPPTT